MTASSCLVATGPLPDSLLDPGAADCYSLNEDHPS